MASPISHLPDRLPRRLPVGATYVVEGYGGGEGNLRVVARYVRACRAGGGSILSPGRRESVRPGRWRSHQRDQSRNDPAPKAEPRPLPKNSQRR